MINYEPAKSCLLILPRHFYSFERFFKEALENKNYKVIVCNDEYPIGIFGKFMGKLNISLLLPITEYVISKDYLNNKEYDLVLIFQGRGISKSLIKKIAKNGTMVVGYNWDSFRYIKAPLRWYNNVTRYCTFDYIDSKQYSLPIGELFSSIEPSKLEKDIEYDISAIMINHSERIKYIDTVLKILSKPKVYIYIYENNIFYSIINFFRNPILYIKYINKIHFNSLDYNEYARIMRKSEFTIDYAHPYQSGITMRCFEAISANTKVITNNMYIKNSIYFNDTNSIIFVENKTPYELIDAYESCKNKPANTMIRNIYDFLDELIN